MKIAYKNNQRCTEDIRGDVIRISQRRGVFKEVEESSSDFNILDHLINSSKQVSIAQKQIRLVDNFDFLRRHDSGFCDFRFSVINPFSRSGASLPGLQFRLILARGLG